MLGNHGIRFSLKHPEIFKAKLRAVQELANKGHKFGVMFPQIISLDEIKQARKIFNELNITNVEFGVMIETPAASILIKDICKEGIDFISFGTNDLTQYTLAIDRGNEDVQYIYDEMNWAVLKQLSRVIRECKAQGVKTSICGQAGSKPEMVEFLVKQGIDSISVNADVAKEISELVRKLEGGAPQEESKEKSQREEPNPRPTQENKPKIEPINNKESIKEEIQEREKERKEEKISSTQTTEQKPTSDIEIVEEERQKEDIFS